MKLPKISIVTPSFNQEQFIEETIKSVVEQNYPNLEYVIIDGGSTDSSVDIIKKYEKHLHYWISEKDAGHGHALNKGFAQTSGEIMAWINSDDKYTPWSFQVVSEIFLNFPHVMWIVGFTSAWNSAGAMTTASRCPKNIYDFLTGNYAWIQQESVFWRRELWEKSGGYINQEYKFMVDGELWTRFFLHAELYSVDCIISGYRVHSHNRALQNYSECMKEIEHAIACMRDKCSESIIKNSARLKKTKKHAFY
jgi:glycosyltransferase involved in cell wall biosynthesis